MSPKEDIDATVPLKVRHDEELLVKCETTEGADDYYEARTIAFLMDARNIYILIARSLPMSRAAGIMRDGKWRKIGIVHECRLPPYTFARIQLDDGVVPGSLPTLGDLHEAENDPWEQEPYVSDRLYLSGGTEPILPEGEPFAYLSAKLTEVSLTFPGNDSGVNIRDVSIARLLPKLQDGAHIMGLMVHDSNNRRLGVVVAVNVSERFCVLAPLPDLEDPRCGVSIISDLKQIERSAGPSQEGSDTAFLALIDDLGDTPGGDDVE